jgi:hypothetical protein
MDKNNSTDSTKIAGRVFHTDDYQKNDELSSGLAATHEQVSDAYMEGEAGGVMDNIAGRDIPLNNQD